MPSPFDTGTFPFRRGDRPGRLLDRDYQNALMRMAAQTGQHFAGFEGLIPPDYQLQDETLRIRILGRTTLADGTFQYAWQRVRVQDVTNSSLSNPLQMDDTNVDSTLQGIYAYCITNSPDVPYDGSAVVEAVYGGAGNFLFFTWPQREWAIGRATATVTAGNPIPWEELSQNANGSLSVFTGGLSGTTSANPAYCTSDVANQTIGILKRGYAAGGARVKVSLTQAADVDTFLHCTQEVYVANASGGTFALYLEGTASASLPYNLTSVDLASALDAVLSSQFGLGAPTVTVTGSGTSGSPFNITFSDYIQRSPMQADIRNLKTTQQWIFFPGGGGGNVTATPDYVVVDITAASPPYYAWTLAVAPEGYTGPSAGNLTVDTAWDVMGQRPYSVGERAIAHKGPEIGTVVDVGNGTFLDLGGGDLLIWTEAGSAGNYWLLEGYPNATFNGTTYDLAGTANQTAITNGVGAVTAAGVVVGLANNVTIPGRFTGSNLTLTSRANAPFLYGGNGGVVLNGTFGPSLSFNATTGVLNQHGFTGNITVLSSVTCGNGSYTFMQRTLTWQNNSISVSGPTPIVLNCNQCCNGTPPASECVDCGGCSNITVYTAAIGSVNGEWACNCAMDSGSSVNMTYYDPGGGDCAWTGDTINSNVVNLYYHASNGTWEVFQTLPTFVGTCCGATLKYVLPPGSHFNCCANNTFIYDSSAETCEGGGDPNDCVGSTITIGPATPCETICVPCCTRKLPSTMYGYFLDIPETCDLPFDILTFNFDQATGTWLYSAGSYEIYVSCDPDTNTMQIEVLKDSVLCYTGAATSDAEASCESGVWAFVVESCCSDPVSFTFLRDSP